MDKYTVPKDMARVLLHAPPLPPGEYTVFLAPAAACHLGHETVTDLLNSSAEFFAARDQSGDFCVIGRRHIRWLQVLYPELDDDYYLSLRDSARRAPCLLTFDDGEELAGDLVAITPQSSPRLLDMLNEETRFQHLEAADDLYLVNMKYVVAARPKGK